MENKNIIKKDIKRKDTKDTGKKTLVLIGIRRKGDSEFKLKSV